MNWQRVLDIDLRPGVPLRERIELLFEQQRRTWSVLREGEAALQLLQKKTLTLAGKSVVVQANPGRRRSTMAKTDAQSVAARPCFLCPQNMPLEERGVVFEDMVVLPNPFPVLPLHCTIASAQHQPQQIGGRIGAFLRLAETIGPDLVTLYNGPRCGASAPDHFHFQAVRADDIPLLRELVELAGSSEVQPYSSFCRTMVVFQGVDLPSIENAIDRSIRYMVELEPGQAEPMFNLMAYFQQRHFTVALFPRTAHRPRCYFAEGDTRLAISPAILEMCGILVTSESSDLSSVTAEIASGIYQEVSVATSLASKIASVALS